MQRLHFEDWTIDVDIETTRKYYENISDLSECQCLYCKNYRVACNSFTSQVKGFFNKLGINPQKEGEFTEVTIDDNKHLYLNFYHLVGNIVTAPTKVVENWNSIKHIEIDNFKSAFTNEVKLVPRDFPAPVIQLEIEVTLPWLSTETPDLQNQGN